MIRKKKSSKKKRLAPNELPGSRRPLTFRKHILPPLAGLLVAFLVFGFFNSEYISTQVAYYHSQSQLTPAATVSLPTTPVDKNAPSKITIPKINVDAPIVFDQGITTQAAFQKALQIGVVHYPTTAVPGKPGNVVIFGHSSGQWWAPGDYKFVFTLLNKLAFDDKFTVDYQGVRYVYRVNNISVVVPTDLSPLNQGSGNTLTLITCSPVGTSNKRLIVRAQQIEPAVATNTTATKPAVQPVTSTKDLPGNRPSFWSSFRDLWHEVF